jgi:hypothetical protein
VEKEHDQATQIDAALPEALHTLDPALWGEVLDFMVFLTQRAILQPIQAHSQLLTAADLLQSELVGLWAARSDIDDSVSFAPSLSMSCVLPLRIAFRSRYRNASRCCKPKIPKAC